MMMHGSEFDRKINIDWLKRPAGSGAQGRGEEESDEEESERGEEKTEGEASDASGEGLAVGSSAGSASVEDDGSATRGPTPAGNV